MHPAFKKRLLSGLEILLADAVIAGQSGTENFLRGLRRQVQEAPPPVIRIDVRGGIAEGLPTNPPWITVKIIDHDNH